MRNNVCVPYYRKLANREISEFLKILVELEIWDLRPVEFFESGSFEILLHSRGLVVPRTRFAMTEKEGRL